MQTQCPNCETRFRITESQVKIAEGFVRCGICQEVFNAYEVTTQNESQYSLLKEDSATNNLEQETPGLSAEDNKKPGKSDTESPLAAFLDSHSITPDIVKPGTKQADVESDKTINFNETSATDESRKEAFDFFDEENNESLPHVVPDKFREPQKNGSPGVISTLLWSAGILLLTSALVIEYAWFNRHQLNQIPQMQAFLEQLCQQVDCNKITMRDPSKIELVTRNVYSHPNEKNALMVNVTMKNTANFAQPYPIMQIDFSDIRGGKVAARRFLPKEYLETAPAQANIQTQAQINNTKLQLLPADTSTTITMEIQDPGKQAMTYEFNFM